MQDGQDIDDVAVDRIGDDKGRIRNGKFPCAFFTAPGSGLGKKLQLIDALEDFL